MLESAVGNVYCRRCSSTTPPSFPPPFPLCPPAVTARQRQDKHGVPAGHGHHPRVALGGEHRTQRARSAQSPWSPSVPPAFPRPRTTPASLPQAAPLARGSEERMGVRAMAWAWAWAREGVEERIVFPLPPERGIEHGVNLGLGGGEADHADLVLVDLPQFLGRRHPFAVCISCTGLCQKEGGHCGSGGGGGTSAAFFPAFRGTWRGSMARRLPGRRSTGRGAPPGRRSTGWCHSREGTAAQGGDG